MNILRSIIKKSRVFHVGEHVKITHATTGKKHLINETAVIDEISSKHKESCYNRRRSLCDITCEKTCILVKLDNSESYASTCDVVIKKISKDIS